jgi:hypothetical protein
MEQHYQILGLETTASLEEIEKKFNVLYKEYNPEKQEGDLKEFFKSEQDKVKEAYKEICLHLIREKEEEEEEEEEEEAEEEEFDWEEDKDKVIKEKEDQEYRRTIHDNDDESDLKITNEGKEGLDKMIYWSKFLAVVGYIALGILSIYTLTEFSDEELFYYVIFIIVCFFPVRYLDRFASKTRLALINNNNRELGEGIKDLGSFFTFYGVIMILFLVLLIYSEGEILDFLS